MESQMEPQPESQRRSERTPETKAQPESQPESPRVPETEAKPESQRAAETEATAKPDIQTDVRYESIEDLPDWFRSTLPEEAQQAYLQAYQDSWDTYEEHEGGELNRAAVAHRDGWNVMSKQYVKHAGSGKWYSVDELPDDEETEGEDEDQGLLGKIKDIF